MGLPTPSESLKIWRAFQLNVKTKSAVALTETPKQKARRIERLLANFERFSKYYFPHYCTSEFASFHKKFAREVINDPNCYIVRAWARSHAKSVLLMLLILFLKFRKELKTMLMVSRTFDNACELLSGVQIELQNNARLINDFGEQIKQGNWEEGDFTTIDGASFRALGMGQNPRGSRNEAVRPDFIAVDDADDDIVVRNPARLDNAWDWLMSALFGCFDITGTSRFVLVGNIIAKDSLVVRASKVEGAKYDIINILDKKGNPSWYQRFTLNDCMAKIKKMGQRLAQKEYFNNPLLSGTVFKSEQIIYTKCQPLKNYRVLVMYTDPSYKHTSKSDYKASAFMGLVGNEWHVIKMFCERVDITKMWEWHYEIYERCQDAGVSVFMAMEANFIQGIHFDVLDKMGKEKYPLPVHGDTRKKPDKYQRIESMTPLFERGLVKWNEKEKGNPQMQLAIEQFLLFQKGSRTNDDAPDAVESAIVYGNKKAYTQNNLVTVGQKVGRTNKF